VATDAVIPRAVTVPVTLTVNPATPTMAAAPPKVTILAATTPTTAAAIPAILPILPQMEDPFFLNVKPYRFKNPSEI
jgi:hypothetical protein